MGQRGVYVADLDSGAVRLVRESTTRVVGPVSWSPDGEELAYFDTRPARQGGRDETSFTAEVLDLATGKTTRLLDAGQCGCGGVAAHPHLEPGRQLRGDRDHQGRRASVGC